MRFRRNPDAVAIALLIGLITVVFFDVLFLGHCFHERDLTVFYYPTKSIVRDATLSGEFPFWNPRYASGQPIWLSPPRSYRPSRTSRK